jgi:hypothetical protein
MFDEYEFLFAGSHFDVNCNKLCSMHLKNELGGGGGKI